MAWGNSSARAPSTTRWSAPARTIAYLRTLLMDTAQAENQVAVSAAL
jgi:hypothetical protein